MRVLLLIALISLAPSSIGDVDDVYYCTTEQYTETGNQGVNQIRTAVFKFKWHESMISFGKGDDYFSRMGTLPITQSYPSVEIFYGGESFELLRFNKGRFRYVAVSARQDKEPAEIVAVLANCEKF